MTFNSRAAAKIAAQTVWSLQPNQYIAQPAPDPEDINWQWLDMRGVEKWMRIAFVYILIFLLIFFWAVPVTFIASLSTLENLAKVKGLDFLIGFLDWSPFLKGLISGFLPSLVLLLFVKFLVTIITKITEQEGFYTKKDLNRAIMNRYFAYDFFNVLLVTTIAGSIFNVLSAIIEHPGSAVELLADSIPARQNFFINYIMLSAFMLQALGLLRPIGFILFVLRMKFFSKTSKDREELQKPSTFSFHTHYASHLNILAITITFSSLSPVLLLFGLLYFLFALIVDSYTLKYVSVPPHDGGCHEWPSISTAILVALLVYLLTMAGVFTAKNFYLAPSLIILAIVLCFFWTWMKRSYNPVSKYGALLPELEATEEHPVFTGVYSQPELKPIHRESRADPVDEAEEPQTERQSSYIEIRTLLPK